MPVLRTPNNTVLSLISLTSLQKICKMIAARKDMTSYLHAELVCLAADSCIVIVHWSVYDWVPFLQTFQSAKVPERGTA